MTTDAKPHNPYLRLLLEAGPLVAFFIANNRFGLMTGTAVFMAATVAALIASRLIERRVPVMPLIGCAFVVVFGGLTLWLEDELFIKIKPTVVNLLFATALFVGLATGRNLLRIALGAMIEIDEAGWRLLTIRWAWFFLFLAALNEALWRGFDTETWVAFKAFGIMPLTLLFSAAQVPTILRHQIPPAEKAEGAR